MVLFLHPLTFGACTFMSTINHHYQIYFGWSKIRVLLIFKFNVFKHISKDTVV